MQRRKRSCGWAAARRSRSARFRMKQANWHTRSSPSVPASHVDLLEKPLFAHLATVRPDGSPQSSVMWFGWDGSRVKFTHTRTRQKFRNLAHDARVAFSIRDEGNPYRFLEVRGEVESIESDPGGAFYVTLQRRYGMDFPV